MIVHICGVKVRNAVVTLSVASTSDISAQCMHCLSQRGCAQVQILPVRRHPSVSVMFDSMLLCSIDRNCWLQIMGESSDHAVAQLASSANMPIGTTTRFIHTIWRLEVSVPTCFKNHTPKWARRQSILAWCSSRIPSPYAKTKQAVAFLYVAFEASIASITTNLAVTDSGRWVMTAL